MRKLIWIGSFFLVVSVVQGQQFVPVKNEPHHHLKLQNEYVQVFDVVVLAGESTLYHRHAEDYVYVVLGNASLKAQVLGKEAQDLPAKDGDVHFAAGPLIHRVQNIGSTPFHNVTVQLLHKPAPNSKSLPDIGGEHQVVVVDNPRVRVIRTTLEPGQSTGEHTHPYPALTIPLTEGNVEFRGAENRLQQRHEMPGVFFWSPSATTHTSKNVGKTTLDVIVIEIK